jgi:hypothetical protein
MRNNVILLKLKHSFLDIICYVNDEDKKAVEYPDSSSVISLESPLIMQMMQNPNTQQHQAVPQELSMFMKDSAKDLVINLRSDDILFGCQPNEELTKEYKKMMSGIEEASVSDISMINSNKGS